MFNTTRLVRRITRRLHHHRPTLAVVSIKDDGVHVWVDADRRLHDVLIATDPINLQLRGIDEAYVVAYAMTIVTGRHYATAVAFEGPFGILTYEGVRA